MSQISDNLKKRCKHGRHRVEDGVNNRYEPALCNVYEKKGGMYLAVTLEDKVFIKRYLTVGNLQKAVWSFTYTYKGVGNRITEGYLKSLHFKFWTYTSWSDKKNPKPAEKGFKLVQAPLVNGRRMKGVGD